MADSKKMDTKERRHFTNGKEIDDDVSVIAVIGKENDRSANQQPDEKVDDRQKDCRVFELNDEKSKMALRDEVEFEELSIEQDNEIENYQSMNVLQKLPPGTIVIKKEKKYKEDSDYVRDSTETSSGGSTSGGGATKIRKVHRATRKNRCTTEVRRNPTRVTKKESENFSRPRQRLLSAKRKETLLDSEPNKRGKSSTMPYMNTRSVTRKMYNVGATYQAPTIKDETEWKEWPVHGMHERPVFHPQVGLAAEYLGRYFTSLDGLSYREIIDRPEIEVVSVDPHCDFLPSSTEKKRSRKTKSNRRSSVFKTSSASSIRSSEKRKSFESCMHESFHCVLGYCSQVMTPTYKINVERKINILNDNKNSLNNFMELEKQPLMANSVEQSSKNESMVSYKDNSQKPMEENKLVENYAVAMFPPNIKNFNQISKTRLFPPQKVYVANSQKAIAFSNLKTYPGGQMKVQEVVRTSKNPFVLVNSPEIKDAQLLKPTADNVNVIKLEESTGTEETLGELSSIYKNVSNEELTVKQASTKRRNKVEFTVTKYLLDNVQQNKLPKDVNSAEKKLCCETSNKELNVATISEGLNKTWCASEASEIAKILSEYNKSNLKKPAIENQTFCTNLKNIRIKELCNKQEHMKQIVQENAMDRNVNITFPQGKWRRFHLTVEKLKDLKNNFSEKKSSISQSKQPLYKMDQTAQDISSERKIESCKQVEPVQIEQSNGSVSLEKKENALPSTNGFDATTVKTQSLQQLLENTAMLYCAATGTHQDDLANYIDSLDAAQSIQWLESCNNLTV